jgi:hypothetical protein
LLFFSKAKSSFLLSSSLKPKEKENNYGNLVGNVSKSFRFSPNLKNGEDDVFNSMNTNNSDYKSIINDRSIDFNDDKIDLKEILIDKLRKQKEITANLLQKSKEKHSLLIGNIKYENAKGLSN